MAKISKIIKYELQDRVLSLSVSHSTTEIAEILNSELDGKDTISQPSVSRYLKDIKAKRAEMAEPILADFVVKNLGTDLEIIAAQKKKYESISAHIFGVITGRAEMISNDITNSSFPLDFDTMHKCDKRIHNLIETTFKMLGLDDDRGLDFTDHPVDMDKFKADMKKADNG